MEILAKSLLVFVVYIVSMFTLGYITGFVSLYTNPSVLNFFRPFYAPISLGITILFGVWIF